MSDLSNGSRRYRANDRVAPERLGERVQLAAVYGAMALIAAIVFGTTTYHPF